MIQQAQDPVEAVKTIFARERQIQEKIDAARTAAAKTIEDARTQARAALAAAEQEGTAAGRTAYEEALAEVDRQAAAITDAATQTAHKTITRSESEMEEAVNIVLDLVLGRVERGSS